MTMLVWLALEILLAVLLVITLGWLWTGRQTILKLLKMCLIPWLLILTGALAFQYYSLINFNHLGIGDARTGPGLLGTLWVLMEAAIWLAPLLAFLDLVFNTGPKGWGEGSLPFTLSARLSGVVFFMFLTAAAEQLFSIPKTGQGALLASVAFGVGAIELSSIWSIGRMPHRRRPFLAWSLLWVFLGAGYLITGRWGLLFLSLPALWMGLMVLHRFASLALPVTRPEQRWLALRCALTNALGTNYPYYVIRDWKDSSHANELIPQPRAPGNPFLQFFAGPGLVLTDCAHAAVLNDGLKYRVAPPGLTFTNIFEQLFAAVDLRPQLRVTTIPAETKDGIVTNTLVFMPHRIDTGGKRAQPGTSLPYEEEAILKAVTQKNYLEHSWRRDETGKGIETNKYVPWDELVLMMGPAIFKSILVNYTCNELHDTQNGQRDPRAEIGQAFRTELKAKMREFGIEMVGGGLSNIVPPRSVVEQRIANWSAKWKKRIEEEIGKAEADITKKLEPVWAEAQMAVYQDLAKILAQAGTLSDDIIAFQLVEALGAIPPKEAIERPEEGLPEFIRALMRRSK